MMFYVIFVFFVMGIIFMVMSEWIRSSKYPWLTFFQTEIVLMILVLTLTPAGNEAFFSFLKTYSIDFFLNELGVLFIAANVFYIPALLGLLIFDDGVSLSDTPQHNSHLR